MGSGVAIPDPNWGKKGPFFVQKRELEAPRSRERGGIETPDFLQHIAGFPRNTLPSPLSGGARPSAVLRPICGLLAERLQSRTREWSELWIRILENAEILGIGNLRISGKLSLSQERPKLSLSQVKFKF